MPNQSPAFCVGALGLKRIRSGCLFLLWFLEWNYYKLYSKTNVTFMLSMESRKLGLDCLGCFLYFFSPDRLVSRSCLWFFLSCVVAHKALNCSKHCQNLQLRSRNTLAMTGINQTRTQMQDFLIGNTELIN